jgi:hypothetical protein
MFADREGRLEDRPNRLKIWIHPYRETDVDQHLQWLHDHGFIVRYQVGNNKYIQILTFLDHQKPHHKEDPSEIPPFKYESSMAQSCVNVEPSMSQACAKDDSSLIHTKPLLAHLNLNLNSNLNLNENDNGANAPQPLSFYQRHPYLEKLKAVASWIVWAKPANKIALTRDEVEPVFAQFEALVKQYGDLLWPVATTLAPQYKSVSQMLNDLPAKLAEKYPNKVATSQAAKSGEEIDWSHMVNE